MSETIRRFRESEILLGQAIKGGNNSIIVYTNLRAFVESARSITWIMQKEFSHNINFTAWYREKQEEMKKDELMKFFLELRNASVKVKAIGSAVRIEGSFGPIPPGETIIPIGRIDEGGNLVIENGPVTNGKGNVIEGVKSQTKMVYFFETKPEADAIELCVSYLGKIKIIIDECIQKFVL